MPENDDQAGEEVEFEDVVSALLKVDPEGIIGVAGKNARKAKKDEPADS